MKKIVPAPYIDQTERWVNGCESISSVMLLQAVGIDIDPDTFIARDLPHAPYWEQEGRLYGPDPMFVYPGDPHDHTGYGCYAPCIVQALQSALKHEGAADRFEVLDVSGETAEQLCRFIDEGMPVVFWACINMRKEIPGPEWKLLDTGERFCWTSNEHCMLLVGYDEEKYYFNDPYDNNGVVGYPRTLVEKRHAAQHSMALGVLKR